MEKFSIKCKPGACTLNKRNKVASACQHVSKYLITHASMTSLQREHRSIFKNLAFWKNKNFYNFCLLIKECLFLIRKQKIYSYISCIFSNCNLFKDGCMYIILYMCVCGGGGWGGWVYVCVFSIDLQCKCFHTTVIEVHYCSNESTVHSK